MKKGTLLALNTLHGEEDFYRLHDALTEAICPDDSGYSVDSMCIGGFFVKDGILLKTSSESPFDCCSIFYNAASLDEAQESRMQTWVSTAISNLG